MFEIREFKDYSCLYKDIQEEIIKEIKESDGVYVWQEYDHYRGKNPLIEWLEKQNTEKINQLILKYINLKEEEKIKAVNRTKIHYLHFTDETKKEFINLFKVSINTMGSVINFPHVPNGFFVLDMSYDQYSYIFVKNNQLSFYADIHAFFFRKVVNEIENKKTL